MQSLKSIARSGLGILAAWSLAMGGGNAAEAPFPDGIRVQMTDEGPAFAAADGQTLYFHTGDRPGKPGCTNQRYTTAKTSQLQTEYVLPGVEAWRTCLEKWPPLTPTDADIKASGNWSIISREDGLKQWAYAGRPLYRSIKDRGVAGRTNGAYDLVGRSPFIATSPFIVASPGLGGPSGITFEKTVLGVVLATKQGRTLYTLSDPLECSGSCAHKWTALSAPTGASDSGPWSVITRKDASRQWAYENKPLFTYVADSSEGDTHGHGVDGGQAVLLYEAPELPKEVTIQPSGLGRLYADANGWTLYAYHCNDETPAFLACDDPGDTDAYLRALCGGQTNCAAAYRPLVAPADAEPIGTLWSIGWIDPRNPLRPVAAGEGTRVWMYRGRPLFTFSGDRAPRRLNGVRLMFITSYWMPVSIYGERYDG